jgi:hypothetical protein
MITAHVSNEMTSAGNPGKSVSGVKKIDKTIKKTSDR